MAAPIPMPTEAHILTLAQWLSPAWPVGAFACSHGLERLVEAGSVRDARTLAGWLEDVLRHGAGQADALFLVAGFRAPDPDALGRGDATCRAFAASKERLAEAELQGTAFCEAVTAVFGHALPPLAYPVAVGRAAALEGLLLRLTTTAWLQAFAANLVAVGTRLIPIGQTGGQRLIRALQPLCGDLAGRAVASTLDDLSATTFLSDIAAMQHETQYSRIFRT